MSTQVSQTEFERVLGDRLRVSQGAIAEFCQRWRIAEFALFGSVLRDDFRPDSDIDVLITFTPEAKHNALEVLSAQRDLEILFQRKVDLTQKKGLQNPFSRANILRTHRIIYPPEKADQIVIQSANLQMQDDVRNHAALLDMVQAIQRIQTFTAGLDFAAYSENVLVQQAVERNLEIIGEAARRRLTDDFRANHSEIDWSGVIGLRNVVAHRYDQLDQERIWSILTTELPPLLEQLLSLLPPLPLDNQ